MFAISFQFFWCPCLSGFKLEVWKITLAQINPTVGDFSGNLAKIIEWQASVRLRRECAADSFLLNWSSSGYPPADFLEKPSFLATLPLGPMDELATGNPRPADRRAGGGVALAAERESGKPGREDAAVLFLDGGRLLLRAGTSGCCSFYDVFDEQRYFIAASKPQQVVELDGTRLAITICEDAWNDKGFWQRRLLQG